MTYFQATLLGVIQGLTEFLPISSSGHLVITQGWLGLVPDSAEMLTFDVISHLGTLCAILLVFRYQIRRSLKSRALLLRILLLAALATVVTAGLGLALRDVFESLFGRPRAVAFAFVLTGTLLFVASRWSRPRKGWRQFGLAAALLVGLAQAVAIAPGISRSGATICAAMMLGLRRRWAAEFSFLIAVPAILGATLLQLKYFWGESTAPTIPGAVLWGGLIAAVTGYVALKLLLEVVRRAKLHYFSYYLWALGVFLLLR